MHAYPWQNTISRMVTKYRHTDAPLDYQEEQEEQEDERKRMWDKGTETYAELHTRN